MIIMNKTKNIIMWKKLMMMVVVVNGKYQPQKKESKNGWNEKLVDKKKKWKRASTGKSRR